MKQLHGETPAMPPPASPALGQKIALLRHAYLVKLPQMLCQVRQQCLLLGHRPDDERLVDGLLREFHNIKGTTASLGLAEISEESAAATAAMTRFRNLRPMARHAQRIATLNELSTHVSRLEALDIRALAAEPQQSGNHDSPLPPPPIVRPDGTSRHVVFFCEGTLESGELGAQLARFGYGCSTYRDADSLRAAVLASPPDAVIASTAAAEVMAQLRSQIRLPVLFIAQDGDFDTRLKAVQAGGEAFFLQPVTAHGIVDLLDRLTIEQEPDPFRVLIVDDEPEMADYHAAILETAGMIVRRLNEPARILDELLDFPPDLVLMDMYMPTSSGADLARLLRQIPQFVGLPIIFLSSETDKGQQMSAMRAGADGFLTKPIVPEDLVAAVVIRAERTRVLKSLMTRDSLTGLLNHTTLSQFLETSLANAQRNHGRLSFVMLDLDQFKKVNDTYGHPAGDQVLIGLAQMLKRRLRSSDIVGRYGGEEFAIVLHDVPADEAAGIMDLIRQDFETLVFKAANGEFSCTFSGGIADFPTFDAADGLIEAADQALYRAKDSGRNCLRPARP